MAAYLSRKIALQKTRAFPGRQALSLTVCIRNNEVIPQLGDNAVLSGIGHQLAVRMQVQFLHQVGAVGFDRANSDAKPFGDLWHTGVFGKKMEYLALAVGQRIISECVFIFNLMDV